MIKSLFFIKVRYFVLKILFSKYQKKRPQRSVFELVRLARLELARPCGQQILSLQRLPVPPQALITNNKSYTNKKI